MHVSSASAGTINAAAAAEEGAVGQVGGLHICRCGVVCRPVSERVSPTDALTCGGFLSVELFFGSGIWFWSWFLVWGEGFWGEFHSRPWK